MVYREDKATLRGNICYKRGELLEAKACPERNRPFRREDDI